MSYFDVAAFFLLFCSQSFNFFIFVAIAFDTFHLNIDVFTLFLYYFFFLLNQVIDNNA